MGGVIEILFYQDLFFFSEIYSKECGYCVQTILITDFSIYDNEWYIKQRWNWYLKGQNGFVSDPYSSEV